MTSFVRLIRWPANATLAELAALYLATMPPRPEFTEAWS